MLIFAAIVYFFCCHAGPAEHFSAFTHSLQQKGHAVHVYAAGPAISVFEAHGIKCDKQFCADDLSLETAKRFAKDITNGNVIMTDIAHPFDILLQKTMAYEAPNILRCAYYDNPENYIPGGYSRIGAETMCLSNKVLFANANLVNMAIYQDNEQEIPLTQTKRVGIGYYPLHRAEKIAALRKKSHPLLKEKLLKEQSLECAHLLTYFGGNNEEYFRKALPAFFNILSEAMQNTDLSKFVILYQQHPGAKKDNIDIKQTETWKALNSHNPNSPCLLLSSYSTEQIQIATDGILYYQTSQAPLFALAGIPVLQIGHNSYPDILARNHLCACVTNNKDFKHQILNFLDRGFSNSEKQSIIQSLGIKSDWQARLQSSLLAL